MYTLLKGMPVREEAENFILCESQKLKEHGIEPKLATVRVGSDEDNIYYESSILHRAENYGFLCEQVVFDETVIQYEIENRLDELNRDDSIHGILLLMPFPARIDEDAIRMRLDPHKDIDAVTDASYANLFSGKKDAFYACTAEACMEICRFYNIDLKGKRVAIFGRSVRVGKPLALMMINANATVTVCHTKTRSEDALEVCKEADIVILSTGNTEGFSSSMFRDGQVIIDAGTGVGKNGKLAGDFDPGTLSDPGAPQELAYSPVPGGVGVVTTTFLLRNVIKAAKGINKINY